MSDVQKVSAMIPVSRQMLLDQGLVEPTAEERRDHEASMVEYRRKVAVATAAWPQFIAALNAVSDPLARAVLDLHKADEHGHCGGCEFSGYEAEPPGWPCETTAVVAAAIGLTVPADLHLAEQYRDWRMS